MKILFYRYGSICEPDIIDGFCELGNEVVTITEEIYNKKLLPSEGVALLNEALQKASYDFVFSINFYPFISEVCNIFQIRYLCWTVDSPVMELYSDSIRNPWNRIFLFDRAQYDEFSRYNPSCIFHLPLASNPTRWKKVISSATDDDISRFSGDISFVGSLYTEKCPYDRLKKEPGYLTGYLEGIMAAQLKVYGYNFLEEILPDSIVEEFRNSLEGFYTPPTGFRRNDRANGAVIPWCKGNCYGAALVNADAWLQIFRKLIHRKRHDRTSCPQPWTCKNTDRNAAYFPLQQD